MASLALGLVLLEAGLRLLLGNFGQSRILQRSDDAEVCLELQPRVEMTYTGWRARVPPSRMRTNSYGIRGPEFSFDKPPGRLRLAAVGDSFTFGQGVEEEEAYVAVAGEALRAAQVPAEVLNFGVPGHATPQSLALVKRRVVPVQPDVVLVGVFPNDLTPEESYCVYGQGDNVVAAWVLRNIYVGRLLYFVASPILRPRVEPGTAERLGTPAERFRAAMTELARLGREHDFLAAAVLLTDKQMFINSAYCQGCQPAHDLVEGTGVHVIDMGPVWRRLQEDMGGNFIQGDDHFSVAGNQTVGRALAQALGDWPELQARVRLIGRR